MRILTTLALVTALVSPSLVMAGHGHDGKKEHCDCKKEKCKDCKKGKDCKDKNCKHHGEGHGDHHDSEKHE